jgi:uncharacterized membrane protein YoaK (UPF0700 family)
MKPASEVSRRASLPGKPLRQRIFSRPGTPLGWWSVVLADLFVILLIINSTIFMPSIVEVPWRQAVLPIYAVVMLACGLAAGMAALAAVIRSHERSWLVWLSLLPGMFVVFLLLGEILVPH